MAESNCGDCKMRAKYDANPKSFGGRFWRWHINWCPGWKTYIGAISPDERESLKIKYKIKKTASSKTHKL